MSKVLEIHSRLKKIEEAKFFPSACVDIAEKLIRRTAEVEFRIVGNIELAYRRGYQAGSYGLTTLDPKIRDELLQVLEAVALECDVIVLDAQTAFGGDDITRDIRNLAAKLLSHFETMPGSLASEGGE